MTAPLPFTRAGLKRAMLAAREAGYRVKGIAPDGTVLVDDPACPTLAPGGEGQQTEGQSLPDASDEAWGDVEA